MRGEERDKKRERETKDEKRRTYDTEYEAEKEKKSFKTKRRKIAQERGRMTRRATHDAKREPINPSLPIPLLPSLLRRRRSISRVERAVRRALWVPKVRRRPTLSLLLRLSRPASLCLCSGTLREPARAGTIEPARLRGRAPAALRPPRATRTDATDVLRACALRIRLEGGLGRRRCAARSEALLVLVRV